VAVSTITYKINHDVFLEQLPILNSELSNFVDTFNIISVDMNDWDVISFAEFGRVVSWSLVNRSSSVADLVVHHQMDAAPGLVFGHFSKQ
jgi:hypothetical protein